MIQPARGFSLVELIAVIIIFSVISVLVLPRFATSDTAAVQAGRDSLVAALFFAQQTAMSRAAGDNVTAEVGSNSVLVELLDGSSVAAPGQDNPTLLPAGVTITGDTGTYTYDKLGRITNPVGPITLTLAKGGVTATVTLEASGYVHH